MQSDSEPENRTSVFIGVLDGETPTYCADFQFGAGEDAEYVQLQRSTLADVAHATALYLSELEQIGYFDPSNPLAVALHPDDDTVTFSTRQRPDGWMDQTDYEELPQREQRQFEDVLRETWEREQRRQTERKMLGSRIDSLQDEEGGGRLRV